MTDDDSRLNTYWFTHDASYDANVYYTKGNNSINTANIFKLTTCTHLHIVTNIPVKFHGLRWIK